MHPKLSRYLKATAMVVLVITYIAAIMVFTVVLAGPTILAAKYWGFPGAIIGLAINVPLLLLFERWLDRPRW